MPWTQNPSCLNCGEPKRLHGANGDCRFEQDGWTPVTAALPDLHVRVTAMRGREVFTALRKETPCIPGPGMEINWLVPATINGHEIFGIVSGVTHWRPLRKNDPMNEGERSILSLPQSSE